MPAELICLAKMLQRIVFLLLSLLALLRALEMLEDVDLSINAAARDITALDRINADSCHCSFTE